MNKPSIEKPHYIFTIHFPFTKNNFIRKPFDYTRSSLGFFGCSSATNTTWTIFVFGYLVITLKKLEYEDLSDKERANKYLKEWSKCEKELQGYRIAQLGENMAPEIKKLIKESLGVDFDEGTIS